MCTYVVTFNARHGSLFHISTAWMRPLREIALSRVKKVWKERWKKKLLTPHILMAYNFTSCISFVTRERLLHQYPMHKRKINFHIRFHSALSISLRCCELKSGKFMCACMYCEGIYAHIKMGRKSELYRNFWARTSRESLVKYCGGSKLSSYQFSHLWDEIKMVENSLTFFVLFHIKKLISIPWKWHFSIPLL